MMKKVAVTVDVAAVVAVVASEEEARPWSAGRWVEFGVKEEKRTPPFAAAVEKQPLATKDCSSNCLSNCSSSRPMFLPNAA